MAAPTRNLTPKISKTNKQRSKYNRTILKNLTVPLLVLQLILIQNLQNNHCVQAINVPQIRENENGFKTDKKLLTFDFTKNEYKGGLTKKDTTFNKCKIIYVQPKNVDPNTFECRPAKNSLKEIELINKITLDREKISEYVLQFRAFNFENRLVAESIEGLTVIVMDKNDNSPVFIDSSLRGQIADNASPGTTVLIAQATDLDDPMEECGEEDKNKCIVFDKKIKSCRMKAYSQMQKECSKKWTPCSASTIFQIDETGRIITQSSIDAEKVCEFRLNITAKDAKGGMFQSLSHETHAEAHILVTDKNDNKPTFYEKLYTVDVKETADETTPLAQVRAYDNDRESSYNSIRYLVMKNFINQFEFRGDKLFLKKGYKLDFENTNKFKDHKKKLTIQAVNENYNSGGSQPSDFADMVINIIDVNEPPVEISTPVKLYIKENGLPARLNPVKTIGTVTVQDLDFLGNQTVTFRLDDPENYILLNDIKSSPASSSPNKIRKYSATVSIRSNIKIDRECENCSKGKYIFHLLATDNFPMELGGPATARIPVTLNIEDENDNAPNFGNPSVTACSDLSNNLIDTGSRNSLSRYDIPGLSKVQLIDEDSLSNGPEFTVDFLKDQSDQDLAEILVWNFEESDSTLTLTAKQSYLPVGTFDLKFKLTDQHRLSEIRNLKVFVCSCSKLENCKTKAGIVTGGKDDGVDLWMMIIVILSILIVLVIIFLIIVNRRKTIRQHPQQPLDNGFNSEQMVHYEPDNEKKLLIQAHSPKSSSNYHYTQAPPSTEFVQRLREQSQNTESYGPFIESLKSQLDKQLFEYDEYSANDELYKMNPIEGDGNAGLDLSSFIESEDNDADVKISPDRGWGSKFDTLADICNEVEDSTSD